MIEGTPIECFLQAVQGLWSGCIDVEAKGEAIGQIVLSKGRVVWATCRGQSETLGILLWRLGRISREQLLAVQRIYKENEGRKKLGVILEEQGFMSRAVLRRCLLLHTRAAVEGILAQPQARGRMIDSEQKTDERILFGPEEVLPEHLFNDLLAEWSLPDNTMVRNWRRRTQGNAILDSLAALPGNQAAAILSFDGGVVSARLSGASVDPKVLAVFVSALLESSSRAVKATGLEEIQTIMVDCTGGWIMACWLDQMRHHSLLLVCDAQGDPALARQTILLAAPQITSWLAAQSADGEAEAAQQEGSASPATRAGAGDESLSQLEHRSPVLREWGQGVRQAGEGPTEEGPAGDMSEALERLVRK